jgi:ankyrin repeat protein
MSPSNARAEISRILNQKKEASTRNSAPSFKKNFSLKRAATSARPTSGPSQDDLTDVLEQVAAEGSLSLVKAVISMGADPIYRSVGILKKVKHEALEKATLNGRAKVVDYLLGAGANYGEAAKRGDYTPMDRMLSKAAYKGHTDLINCLVASHGANPMVEQWPKEMYDAQHYWVENEVRVAKTSLLDGLSRWKNVDRGMSTLMLIMQHPDFDPTAFVSGVFDNKSERQSAELV